MLGEGGRQEEGYFSHCSREIEEVRNGKQWELPECQRSTESSFSLPNERSSYVWVVCLDIDFTKKDRQEMCLLCRLKINKTHVQNACAI